MTGDRHVRICERVGLQCPALLDYAALPMWAGVPVPELKVSLKIDAAICH